MPITMTCACGKTLSVPDDAAGRRARCPACNAVMQVPGTPPEPPAEPAGPRRTTDRVDEVIDAFSEDLARSRERAPEMTQIAKGLLVWAGAAALLTFLAALFADDGSLVQWLVVHLPMAIVAALLGVAMIKAWHRTPTTMTFAAPLMIGANYVMFWGWANRVSGWGTVYFVISLVYLGGFLFLYWYFRQPGVVSVFTVPAVEADASGSSEGKTSS